MGLILPVYELFEVGDEVVAYEEMGKYRQLEAESGPEQKLVGTLYTTNVARVWHYEHPVDGEGETSEILLPGVEYWVLVTVLNRRTVEYIQEDHDRGRHARRRVIAWIPVAGIAHPGLDALIDMKWPWVCDHESQLQGDKELHASHSHVVKES